MPDSSFLRGLAERYPTAVPHCHALGMRITQLESTHAEMRMACRPEFLGDIERGVIHTGVVTSLIDSACGVAVLAHLGVMERIATLDLRVDYLRASRPDAELVCRAECFRSTPQIMFVRAHVWQDDPSQPVAVSQAAFMRPGGVGPI
jgi:uncharacterized protein (TIGR00369 family)